MQKPRVVRHEVTQPFDKPYRYIPLTQGQTAIVDASDFYWLSQWHWFAHWKDGTKSFYVERLDKFSGVCISMHRFILGLKKGEICDHKNGNTLDNRRENLRRCTMLENAQNRKINARNKSGYKGVHLFKNRWKATITFEAKRIHLGYFDSPREAAEAYNLAATIFYGQFANLNKII